MTQELKKNKGQLRSQQNPETNLHASPETEGIWTLTGNPKQTHFFYSTGYGKIFCFPRAKDFIVFKIKYAIKKHGGLNKIQRLE